MLCKNYLTKGKTPVYLVIKEHNHKFTSLLLEYTNVTKAMLINWLFPESMKREEEEHKQLLHNLSEFYKLCEVKEGKNIMPKVRSFVLSEDMQDMKNKDGSIALVKVEHLPPIDKDTGKGEESTNIKAIGYCDNLLYVMFKKTDLIYSYKKVPQQIIIDFLKADSKGKYFNIFIRKGGYSYKKVGKL